MFEAFNWRVRILDFDRDRVHGAVAANCPTAVKYMGDVALERNGIGWTIGNPEPPLTGSAWRNYLAARNPADGAVS